jgi:hypothetical protein
VNYFFLPVTLVAGFGKNNVRHLSQLPDIFVFSSRRDAILVENRLTSDYEVLLATKKNIQN